MKFDGLIVMKPTLYPLILLLVLFGVLGSSTSWAKTTPVPKPKTSTLTISQDSIQQKMESIKTRPGLDEALKSKVLSIYQAALDNLANSENFKAQAANFSAELKLAPEKSKQLHKSIDQTLQHIAKQHNGDFSNLSVEQLEQNLVQQKGLLSTLEEQLAKLDSDLVLQQARPQHIREELLVAKQDFENVQKKLEGVAETGASKLEAEANAINLKTLFDARTAELKMLDVEAISNPTRVDLIKTEGHLLDVQKTAVLPVITAIENLLTERRQQEAKLLQDELRQAEKELSGKHTLIQQLTRENIKYSRDLQDITSKIDNYTERKAKVDAKATEIDSDFKSAEKKIRLAGLSPALGRILREQRRNLEIQDQFAQQSEAIQNETATTSLEQFKIEDKLKQLSDPDSYLQDIMNQQVDSKLPVGERMLIQTELRLLLNNQKDLLNKRALAYTTYLRTLGDFDFARQQLLNEASKFASYLDENLLWVKSSEPIGLDSISGLFHSAQWLLSPHNWLSFVTDTVKLSVKSPFLVVLGIVSLILMLLGKHQAKAHLAVLTVNVEKIYTDHFNYTLQALALTLAIVIPLPLFSYYVGWFLETGNHAGDFTKAMGRGLQSAAIPLFFIQFYYRIFAPEGIARKHFQWQQHTTRLIHKQLAWLRFFSVLTVFMIQSTAASKVSLHSDNLGRLGLNVSMLAIALFLARLLHPSKGIMQDMIRAQPDGWLAKLRYVWYPAAISVPLVIIGFAVAGYYLSALELQEQLILSLRMIFLLIIVYEMVVRWLTLVNRQLAITNARQKRKAAFLAEKQPAPGGEDPILPVDEQLIDIPKINAQTIRLLNVFTSIGLTVGFFVIWKNILPAFTFIENIVLWQHVVSIDNQDSLQPVTLTNLMLAGVYFFVAVVSVRNFSGLMELLVFRRVNIEAGSRYAINQLANYTLLAIAFITIANELGGSWSQVQWLVAALSVGLGFGLQEIFANLVSGIILLFERPIRVGDTVTISDVTGKVSRIQMRATTLIDMDQKEHVVPNKTFITSQLVNWSLSDAITRIVIPVGVAYGSDVELAQKVIMDTVKATPLVMSEPPPSVLLMGFGDNALNFSIRIFVSEVANRLPVTHDIHVRLEKALRENNITIPFPQRDIYLHTAQEHPVANLRFTKAEESNKVE